MKLIHLIALALVAGSAAVAVASRTTRPATKAAVICCDNPLPPCDPYCSN